ncbi:MAG: Fic family protein [Endomicrobiales bacterium]|jgi:Fic family protein
MNNKKDVPISKFDQRLQSIPSKLWLQITRIDELKGQWSAETKLSPYTLGKLKHSVLVTSTGSSTRIEGAQLSDEEIEKLLRGLSIQKLVDRDQQEVQGYYELLQNVFEAWEDIPFNESTIKHFHKELLKYVEKDKRHLGEYKKKENQVHAVDGQGKIVGVVFDTTPAYRAPLEMQSLVSWTKDALQNKELHPLIVIANFIVEFLAIHPFEDGNGRMSRILTNLLLLKAGYAYVPYVSHEKLIEDNKKDYYLALRQSQKSFKSEKGTIAPWLQFFLDIMQRQTNIAIDLLGNESVEHLLSPKQLAAWKYLHSVDEATPGEIARNTNTARPTVNQILTKLLKLGKIEKLGLGRSTRYKAKK